ncbi:helix-turn-helix domain-containing protein [Streptomyces sp. NPDC001435]|uniref:helix-turn-helix domain-containing protein n=1 Tax=Streptomyces sp. NPDC001435 TaxID=3364576 RepID=UPI0036807B1D
MTTDPRPRTQITDATGRQVAFNVRRIREARGWSTYDLSRLLKAAGRPIAPSAIAKVERAERRVDVGDLTALAAALGVNPSALLLPLKDGPADSVEVTGGGSVAGADAWDWADGKGPLRVPEGDFDARLQFDLYARPPRRRNEIKTPDHITRAAADIIAELAKDGRSGLVINPRHIEPGQQEGDANGPSVD